jgi:ABC-type nitrate/sulfonate/bicarbonate transport system permease component
MTVTSTNHRVEPHGTETMTDTDTTPTTAGAHLDARTVATVDEERAGVAERIGRRTLRILSSIWLLAVLLVVWELMARRSESLFFPPVSTIFTTLRDEYFSGTASQLFLSETFHENVWPSLARAAQGWGAAIVVGVSLGVLIGVWRNASLVVSPLVRFGMSIPATVLLPLAVVIFGVTSSMNVFLIAFGSVWVVLVNTMDGVRNIDETAMTTARSLRLGRARTFFSVLLPGASPQIFSGLRVSIGITLILMVVSELFAATSGIGYYIVYSQRTFMYQRVWAGVFLLAIIGILVNIVYAVIERRVLRWHLQSRQRD